MTFLSLVQIKRFEAKDIQEALKQVKEGHGPGGHHPLNQNGEEALPSMSIGVEWCSIDPIVWSKSALAAMGNRGRYVPTPRMCPASTRDPFFIGTSDRRVEGDAGNRQISGKKIPSHPENPFDGLMS